MNRYGITINNRKEEIYHASKSYTAVRNAMAAHVEGEFKPCATIKIRFIDKVTYTFDVIADVPFVYGENGIGTTRTTVATGFETREAADIKAQELSVSHHDWKFVRILRKVRK